MNITITLDEVLDLCDDWEYFCEQEGWNEWCINEGGGDILTVLSYEKAIKYGIIKGREA